MKVVVALSFPQSSAPLSAKTALLPPPSLFFTGLGSRGRVVIAMARRDFAAAAAAAASPKREEAAATPISSRPPASLEPSPAFSASTPTSWAPLAGLAADELDLDFTLPTGQSFRWRRTAPAVYTGVVGRRVVQVSQREAHLLLAASSAPASSCAAAAAAFRVLVDEEGAAAKPPALSPEQQLADYFNADVSLSPLAAAWAAADPRWAAAAAVVRGARVLRQPPLECLLSFVCSSNNSISRITGMVEHLARRYGTLLASAEEVGELLKEEEEEEEEATAAATKKKKRGGGGAGAAPPATPAKKPFAALSRSGAPPAPRAAFYSFPTLEQLSGRVTEQELREAGFGYRARYIVGTIEALSALAEARRRGGGEGKRGKSSGVGDDGDGGDFLLSLRKFPEEEALRELAKLPGVGPKVAACVALFSLDKHAVVPVGEFFFFWWFFFPSFSSFFLLTLFSCGTSSPPPFLLSRIQCFLSLTTTTPPPHTQKKKRKRKQTRTSGSSLAATTSPRSGTSPSAPPPEIWSPPL
jgi:N-glycosylase/DNA lyase